MKTLEEFIEAGSSKEWVEDKSYKTVAKETAAEILRVAEEWCRQPNGYLGSGYFNDHAPAASLNDFLKSYITGPSTSASLEEKESDDEN